MSRGGISDYKKRQFASDLQRILELTSTWLQKNTKYISNAPKVFEASPITASFDIKSLLTGVRDKHLTQKDKQKLIKTVHSSLLASKVTQNLTPIISGNTVIKNYDTILRALRAETYFNDVPNAEKIINSMSSGIPDAMYLANAGLNLGKSPLLDHQSVFVIQSPLMVERQIENAFTRSLSIQMGSFPLEMERVYEGMADSVAALVNINGTKKRVLIGFNSTRSDPMVYQEIVNLAKALKVVPQFPEDVVILEANRNISEHAYHMDVALLTLPNSVVCVGEGK